MKLPSLKSFWLSFALITPLAGACADLTELQQIREDQAAELATYLNSIKAAKGATLIISKSDQGKWILDINEANHPLRGVSFEVTGTSLPDFDESLGESLVLALTPNTEKEAGLTSQAVGRLNDLTDQTVVGPIVNVELMKFPGQTAVEFVNGGLLTLPIEACVPALLEEFLGAANLTENEALVAGALVKFRNRQVVAPGAVVGTYAPVLGGGKVCGGLGTSQPPIAGGLQFSMKEDEVLAKQLSVVDDNPDTLVYELVTGTSHGTVTLEADGSFIYVPEADFYGQDSFKFTAFDGYELSNTGEAIIFVSNVNDAPIAYPANISANVTIDIDVNNTAPGTVTATDIDSPQSALHFRVEEDALYGVVLMPGSGDGDFTYYFDNTAAACAAGQDVFVYIADDLFADSQTAVVTIDVNGCVP